MTEILDIRKAVEMAKVILTIKLGLEVGVIYEEMSTSNHSFIANKNINKER